MTTAFDAPLNESLRDAMLALYLHEAVPNDPDLIELGLAGQIKTANDLYEYWLLDVLVSQNVPTSPVACAIASHQQLINGIMLNMEPGYSDHSLTAGQMKTWRDGLNRYPIWAATQQLHYFPDIYLDPTLRLTKTDSFEQLESDLNQAQIQPDTVQAAVLAYLGRFEEIANLKVCNGYIDGEDFANSTYYFIGKSPAENTYYWRALDMRQRPAKAPAATPGVNSIKYDKPLPNAWTDWQRANVPISEKAIEHTIRPCWFNNRLFVIWAELELQDQTAMAPETIEGKAANTVNIYPRLRLYASYQKYDDSWSTPRVYIESYCKTLDSTKTPDQLLRETQTIAVYDHSTSPESMFIALYSNYVPDKADDSGNKDSYDFLRTLRIDKNFKVSELFPLSGAVIQAVKKQKVQNTAEDGDGMAHVQSIGRLFAKLNAGCFQYWLPTGTPQFGSVEIPNTYPETPLSLWNFDNLQSNIKDSRKDQELVYDRDHANIKLIVKQEREFPATLRTEIVFVIKNDPIINLTLVYLEGDLGGSYVTLLEGSTIKASNTALLDVENGTFAITVKSNSHSLIANPGDGTKFSVERTAKGESSSLEGKALLIQSLEHLYLRKHTVELKRISPGAAAIKFDGYDYYRGRVGYQQVVMHPRDVISEALPETWEDVQAIYSSSIVNSLSKDSTLQVTFSIDQNTFRPDGWEVVAWPDEPKDVTIPLIYGVLVYHSTLATWSLKGGALKALRLTWGQLLITTHRTAPQINTEFDSQSLGTAQFIDFSGSDIEQTDSIDKKRNAPRAPIRMNTVFARTLINLAENGMGPLLSWETQTSRIEPPFSKDFGPESMDFSGAFYLYFLELFLYLPWLVAHRLNEEQQYDEARHWLSYVFDPSRQSSDPGHPGYWQAVPLENPVWPGPADPSQAILYPDDPHQIALSFPVHFQKALYGLYIDIESNQADQAYRELTPDGLADAKLRYVHIMDLLGPRADVRQVDDWTPIQLDALSSTANAALREFEARLVSTQHEQREQPPLRIGKAPDSEVAPLLCLRPYSADSSLSTVDNQYLRRPFNPELIQRWERTESRLYNLRHHLDMAGNPLNLPLFAAPLDPRALLAAWGQGLSGAALSRLLSPQIAHYRFTFMFALAQNAVDSVIQFGATLLSLIERKEQAQYLELQQQQAWNLAKVAVDIQIQATKIDEKNQAALQASQAIIEARVSYYEKLLNEGVSALEIEAGGNNFLGGAIQAAAYAVETYAESAKGAPNIIGFAVGGQRIEAPAASVVSMLKGASSVLSTRGQLMDRIEQYRRRAQEWTQAHEQAKLEAEQIQAQLAVYEEQHKATRLQLRQAQTALNQARASHDFLLSSNRFSRSQTYDWLNSKFAGFYHSASAPLNRCARRLKPAGSTRWATSLRPSFAPAHGTPPTVALAPVKS
ncbi:neuraminidase-like domain-containing protein [Pseudomonas sp.]|uniref:neuraminidase-like domain-containing protein n=1 Tax=Pseudomonas sp. TaxID=306 RepID=UPI003BB51634